MKKFTLPKCLLLLIFLVGTSSYFNLANAQDASLSFATFQSKNQAFVEVYLHVLGRSVNYQPVDAADSTRLQASVEVTLLIKKEEAIIKVDKFNLISPIGEKKTDFIDLKRYGLANGDYELEVSIKDNHATTEAKIYKTPLKVNYDNTKVQQSDIQLLADSKQATEAGVLVKNNIYMEPLAFQFYGKTAEALMFYNEVYNTDKYVGDDYLISYSIEKVANGNAETILIGHKRKKPQSVTPILLKMDITELPSGNYNLVVEVRDRDKATLSKKSTFFQRSNPYLNIKELEASDIKVEEEFVALLNDEELDYGLRALAPLTAPGDVELLNVLIKGDNKDAKKLYLFNYWARRSPTNPKKGFDEYLTVVKAVDRTFKSGFRYGFETDRGHIFLKYGRPSDITTVIDEPTAPPYEIWSYNQFPQTNQNNVRFLFYNPSLAGGDYILLHSTARGELNNPRWEQTLYEDAQSELQGNSIDGATAPDGFNRRAREYFTDF